MQYEPLDKTTNEIRVLQFLDLSSPVSTEDIIQCSVGNVLLKSPLDPQPHQEESQNRTFPIAWDKFTKSVDLRDANLEPSLDPSSIHAATQARLHRSPPQSTGSRYDWGDFEALSYTWGNIGEAKAIQINGVRKNVSRNLEEALRALRDLEETTFGMCYWIDSLCIDQENIEERNEQVKRMKEIYGRARAVIVWLGQEEEHDRIAAQLMHGRRRPVQDGLHNPIDKYYSEWPALVAFTQKPYWNRCWIIQELAMNHNSTLFLCGEIKLTRKMLGRGVSWSETLLQLYGDWNDQSEHPLQLGSLALARRMYRLIDLTPNNDFETDLNSLLDLIRRADATDKRDKIYSILGLLDPAISAGVTPDYSVSVQQVYTSFMKSVINVSQSLDAIIFSGISAEQGWSSWVPDWRKPPQRHYSISFKSLQPSREIPAQYKFIEKENDRIYLACSGFQVDTVDGIAAEPPLDSHATRSSTVSDRYSGRTLEALYKAFDLGHVGIWAEQLFKVPWNLSRGTDNSVAKVPSNSEWLKIFQSTHFERWDNFRKYNKDFCIGGHKLQSFFPPSDSQSPIVMFTLREMRLALRSLDYRALITTITGYLGLAPVETRPGDVIAILLGCRWPVILRPCKDGFYQVIGECYIAGLMEGEILDQQRDGHVSEREFVLC